MLPRVQHAPARVPCRRPRSLTGSWQQGPAQVVATLGGAVHHPRGALTRDHECLAVRRAKLYDSYALAPEHGLTISFL
jgi:hypothetical protein